MKLIAIIANWFKRPAPTKPPPGYLIEQNQNGQFRWVLPEPITSKWPDTTSEPVDSLDDALRGAWDHWRDSQRLIETNAWSRVL